jgi:hypothetical protein
VYVLDQWAAKEDHNFPGMYYSVTRNGWMESEVLLNYMERPLFLHSEMNPQYSIKGDKRVMHLACQNSVTI